MLYRLLKPLLFALPPEAAHALVLKTLRFWPFQKSCHAPMECMGLAFKNPIGLSAGLDKNGDYLNALGRLGFGFIEVGTVTPKPQTGNPKPRLFRYPAAEALINAMGFNNHGVDHLVQNLKKRRYDGIVGVNIGKNKTTPEKEAIQDYLLCFEKVYPHADYITINLSSPNTPGLRALQKADILSELLREIMCLRVSYQERHQKHVPVCVKVAPDLDTPDIKAMADVFLSHAVDGVIVSNTTTERFGFGQAAGGLSGAPLFSKSTKVLSLFASALKGQIPLIGVGGIDSKETAQAKREAGASLLQLYTGLIFKGPALISEACNGFLKAEMQ